MTPPATTPAPAGGNTIIMTKEELAAMLSEAVAKGHADAEAQAKAEAEAKNVLPLD